MDKQLGKIKSVQFGRGGYDDAMFGITFHIGDEHGGCSDFWGTWAHRSERSKWTTEDQEKHFGETMQRLNKLMAQAKVKEFSQLRGVPIEIEWEDFKLKSWRILTEVL